jgi:nicotinate-nucleotide--dimethylbenzimidazole phosphoribosyltransferase
MSDFNIQPLSTQLDEAIQTKIDLKTKPIGALGTLESIALQLCRIQQTLEPKLTATTIAVFAADHGIAKEGLVNPYPQEVTFQMVMNFLGKGAAINVFAAQHQIALKVVDAGVNYDFNGAPGLIDAKVAYGTQNYLEGPAMTPEQCEEALQKGADIVVDSHQNGSNCIGFGEMGIGNTSSSALLMSALCGLPLEDCVGKGTGVNTEQFQLKLKTLKQAQEKHQTVDSTDPMLALQTFGGFEIAQMCGGMLKAAELGMCILVDGFISSAALLVAQAFNKNVLDYAICTHQSEEQGHIAMLNYLDKKALISIGMRLGEGSGIAVAYPLLQSACDFMQKMASFEAAAVSNKA